VLAAGATRATELAELADQVVGEPLPYLAAEG
jgi:hypothetical protein